MSKKSQIFSFHLKGKFERTKHNQNCLLKQQKIRDLLDQEKRDLEIFSEWLTRIWSYYFFVSTEEPYQVKHIKTAKKGFMATRYFWKTKLKKKVVQCGIYPKCVDIDGWYTHWKYYPGGEYSRTLAWTIDHGDSNRKPCWKTGLEITKLDGGSSADTIVAFLQQHYQDICKDEALKHLI